MNTYDFAIAGYGPTGATIANLLGRKGYSIALIDKETEIYPKPRAITADHEALRVFQECGLADEISAGSVPHPGTDYLGLEGQIIKQFYPLASAIQPLAWEPTFMFAQPELEAVLRRGVLRYQQIDTLLGHELVRFDQDEQGVNLQLTRARDQQQVSLRARYLLACDGGRSLVRRQLASVIEDLAFDEWWIVIDAHLREETSLPRRCVQYCRPSRPGTYIVGPDKLRRWEIKMLPGETPDDFQTDAALRRVLAEFVDEKALEIIRAATYRFHALVVDRWREGRVFLMGDAAHQTPPFMGQGLCAGVRDAVNLAWKLDMVERQGAAPALLDTYVEERKPHVRTVVAHAKEFGLIIGELDVDAARLRDARLTEELTSGKAETVRQKFIPDLDCGLLDLDAHARPRGGAGQLFVQPWVIASDGHGEVRRLDDLTGFGFLLATDSADLLDGIDEPLYKAWQGLGGAMTVIGPNAAAARAIGKAYMAVQERDGIFAEWLARTGARAALVRPDRYVYGTASDAAELNALILALLERLAIDAPAHT